MTLMTAQTASGTSIDFTGIPSWAKRITVMFNGVSTSGTSVVQVQLGDSGGVEGTGYSGNVLGSTAAGYHINGHTTGFPLSGTTPATAANAITAIIVFVNISANLWGISGTSFSSSYITATLSGSKTLSGILDRLRVTTVNGTDTFDAGSINIMYEG
jgi:hypothetical protein